MKTITHTEIVKQRILTIQEQVQKAVGVTHKQYCDLQFNMGFSYLNLETEGNYLQAQKVAETKEYWSWWKNHWTKREQRFLSLPEEMQTYDFYLEFHNPNSITFTQTNPHLETSYAYMVSRVIKMAVHDKNS